MASTAPVVLLNGLPADGAPGALRALAQVNYGHFTSLQARDGAVQGLDLHLARLVDGTTALFDAALDVASVRRWMREAVAAAGGSGSVRVTVFSRHFDHRDPLRPVDVDVLVAVAPPVAVAERALRVQARAFVRTAPGIKHVGTFPLFHHRRQALQAGFHDALFVDGHGREARVVEGSVWNVAFWDGERVVWPDAPALRGTTERLLQAGLAAAGVAQVVRPVAVAELEGFQAAFAANANGLRSIKAIDGVEYRLEAAGRPAGLLQAALGHAPWEPL